MPKTIFGVLHFHQTGRYTLHILYYSRYRRSDTYIIIMHSNPNTNQHHRQCTRSKVSRKYLWHPNWGFNSQYFVVVTVDAVCDR